MGTATEAPVRTGGEASRGLAARRLALTAVFVAYLALGLYYNVANPIWEAPDEPAHYEHVLYIVENRTLPVRQQKQSDQLHQPPLYYVVGSLIVGGLNLDDRLAIKPNPYFIWNEPRLGADPNLALHTYDELPPYKGTVLAVHLLRLVSLLFSAVAVWVAYALARKVLPDRPWLAVAAAAATALTPQYLYVGSTLGNDGPAVAFGSLTLLATVEIAIDVHMRRRVPLWRYALLGVWLGLGAISKLTFFGVLPAVAVAGVYTLIAGKPRLRTLGEWAVSGILAALLSGWWYARNLLVYGTTFDILGQGRFDPRTTVEIQEKPEQMAQILSWYPEPLFQSFWLRFGWMNIYPDRWVYDLALAVCLTAVVGLAVYVLPRLARRASAPTGATLGLAICGLALLSAFTVTTWRFAYTIGNHYPQGRYLFPVQPAVALLLVLGLATLAGLPPRWLREGGRIREATSAVAAVAFSLALAAGSYAAADRYLVPAYRYLPVWQRFGQTTLPNPLDANYAGELSLIGYDLVAQSVSAGETVTLNLYWRAEGDIPMNMQAFVHVADATGKPVAQKDGPLGVT
ncbi:MAG: ArnT family glycosyltransferase, partial [Chloroflexota bacterium]